MRAWPVLAAQRAELQRLGDLQPAPLDAAEAHLRIVLLQDGVQGA
jgi:hypothetical protein